MKPFGLVLSVGTFLQLVLGPAQAQHDVADIILVKANVFTGPEAYRHAEAIAIKGDRILAVGIHREISSLAGPETKRIDVGGRLVIPGLMDTHNHYSGAGLPTVTHIDFGEWAPSGKRGLEMVAQKLKSVPAGNLLFGFMGPEAFFDPDCTPAVLDRIAPQTPVFLAGVPQFPVDAQQPLRGLSRGSLRELRPV